MVACTDVQFMVSRADDCSKNDVAVKAILRAVVSILTVKSVQFMVRCRPLRTQLLKRFGETRVGKFTEHGKAFSIRIN